MLKENSMIKQSNNYSLPSDCQQLFRAFGCPATRVNQLVSGVKIAKVVNNILFDGKNPVLSNQIITQNEERKGNNVINFNMILKQVKINPKVSFPQTLQSLSPFKLMDSEQQMINFVKWLMQHWDKNEYQTKYMGNQFESLTEQKQNLQRNTPFTEKQQNQNVVIRNKKISSNRTALQPQAVLQLEHDMQIDGKQLSPSDNQDVQKQQNLFQNVFFCDRDISPKNNEVQLNDSLQMSEKVSKKGSFKVFRPKTNFENQNQKNQQNGNSGSSNLSPQKIENENKRQFTVTENIQRYFSQQKQQSRKTIPKMVNRPPLYKKLDKNNKQQTIAEHQRRNQKNKVFKEPSPFQMQNKSSNSKVQQMRQNSAQRINIKETNLRHNKNQSLKQIDYLQRQIKIESQTNFATKVNSQTINESSLKNSMKKQKSIQKSQRKLFKIDLKQVDEADKKQIIQWLISINLLNSNATNYYHRFHEICKNGVIFPQIINHQIGRFKELCYFKNPTKSAQVHSNYQKVFNYLKDVPTFESDLLFMYEFFVPQSIQNAFWGLLKSCWQCFTKSNNKSGKTYNRESYVKEKIALNSDSDIKKQSKQSFHGSLQKSRERLSAQYQKIKFGSSQQFRKTTKKTQTKQQAQHNEFSQKSQKSKRKASLDFIKDLPQSNYSLKHEELVQIEEPIENKKVNAGYKQLHELRKNHNTSSFINTPKKRNENSVSKSRIVSVNSNKKTNQKIDPPSVTLQMQIKSLNYIKAKGLINMSTLDNLSLFEDPIRNGTLLNQILCDQLKLNYKYNLKPRNIVDCKQNFTKGLAQIRESFIFVPHSYQIYFQNIIKGELSLFYGLIWHIINSNTNKQDIILKDLRGQSAILSISKNYDNYTNMENEKIQEEIMFWVRQLEQQSQQIASLHIRNMNSLSSSICSNNLLYKVASIIVPEKYNLKPTYEQPVNHLEQQSNLKKILSYYAHNKVLRSQLAWKAKSLVRKQKATTIQIMKSLMSYYKNIKKTATQPEPENPVISFVKFTRQKSREQNKSKERTNQRLETTMANNSFSVPLKKEVEKSVEKVKKQQQPVEIPWMRSLGFIGDLSLNNGVILCRLISKLTMKSLNFNENPNSKAECLTNIRKALRLIEKFKWDQEDIASADQKTTVEVYKFLRQKYKHSYAMKEIC